MDYVKKYVANIYATVLEISIFCLPNFVANFVAITALYVYLELFYCQSVTILIFTFRHTDWADMDL